MTMLNCFLRSYRVWTVFVIIFSCFPPWNYHLLNIDFFFSFTMTPRDTKRFPSSFWRRKTCETPPTSFSPISVLPIYWYSSFAHRLFSLKSILHRKHGSSVKKCVSIVNYSLQRTIFIIPLTLWYNEHNEGHLLILFSIEFPKKI